jgi:hypothetical protein
MSTLNISGSGFSPKARVSYSIQFPTVKYEVVSWGPIHKLSVNRNRDFFAVDLIDGEYTQVEYLW